MSQSKIPADNNDRCFVISHSFENVLAMNAGATQNGPIQKHYNIPWRIRISSDATGLDVFLDCMVPVGNEDWKISTLISGKADRYFVFTDCSVRFARKNSNVYFKTYPWTDLHGLLNNGNLNYEFMVTIREANGLSLNGPLRIFDDEAAREDSDVTLIIQGQKFHVLKKYLSAHSSYFKTLFSGSFLESQKSEIELKDIDPNDFHLFLELIYGESLVGDSSALKILHLADFFDSKSAIRRCQDFLLEKSMLSLKEKFHASLKYKLDELQRKCFSQLKTHADFLSIVPEDSSQFNSDLWKELFVKSNSLGR